MQHNYKVRFRKARGLLCQRYEVMTIIIPYRLGSEFGALG